MSIVNQFLINTPFWVWVLLVYLIIRGIKARKPASTTLMKIAMLPILFTLISLYDLFAIYSFNATTTILWGVGILFGSYAGWYMIPGNKISIDKNNNTILRPADYTLLPLIILTFIIKYSLGVIDFLSPELLNTSFYKPTFLILYGFFTGIFIGKFSKYYSVWRSA